MEVRRSIMIFVLNVRKSLLQVWKFSMKQTHRLNYDFQKKSLSCYTKKINQIKSDCGFDDVAVSFE